MDYFTTNEKKYEVDIYNFLRDFHDWDEDFARGMAAILGITDGLTNEHWDVINSIRNIFLETGRCPIVYEICRKNGLTRRELKALFPTGYLRGACKIAGITYKEGYLGQTFLPASADDVNIVTANKSYQVDVRGFLINSDDWDEYYAAHRAYDMKIPGGKLTDKHWQIIKFLRDSYAKNKIIPTVYETCDKNSIELDELEKLFPDGYHRGAVKIAGLRAR
jgi:tRNA 2-thiouridine synthesizing protein E